MNKRDEQAEKLANDNKTTITLLLLIFVYPLGLIVMWFLPKWPVWVKILVSLPIILFIILIVAFVIFATISWKQGNEESAKIQKVSNVCDTQCKEVAYPENASCFNKCTEAHGIDYKRRYLPAAVITGTPTGAINSLQIDSGIQ